MKYFAQSPNKQIKTKNIINVNKTIIKMIRNLISIFDPKTKINNLPLLPFHLEERLKFSLYMPLKHTW
jgi:hypothetical protein